MKRRGTKTISQDGEVMKNRTVRMTDEEWEKCVAIGGAAWIREQIKYEFILFSEWEVS